MGDIEIIVYYQCPIGCSSCDNSGNCSACIQNYNLDQKQKQCLLTCNSNQFIQVDQNSTLQVCQSCDPSCSTCSGTSTSCTSCSNNYYTLKNLPSDTNFLCYSICPDGYYQFSQDCLKCDVSCSTCTGNSLSCTACSNSYYPYKATLSATNFQCYQICPNGSYFLQNQCLQCDASCSICIGSSTNCTTCSNTYYPLKDSPTATNFQCYQTCPNGYYLQFQQCLKCDASCNTCSDSSLSCTKCANNYYPLKTTPSATNFQCYQTCPDGYFLLQQQCQKCDVSCQTCNGTSISCTNCSNTYYPLKTSDSATNFHCYQITPDGYYLDSNQQYKKCDISCSSCSGTSTSCTACKNTFYPLKIQPSDTNYKCYQTCPDGYFLQQQQQECQQCDVSCSKCIGNSNNCTACQSSYYQFLTTNSATEFQCYQICPNNYQLKQNMCQQCTLYSSEGCHSCGTTCKLCQANQISNCVNCYETMQISGSQCICRNPQDQRNIFYQCSYDNYAVVQAIFDSISPILTLEFGSNLVNINNLTCDQIFDSATYLLLGSNSSCEISQTKIVVSLSNDAIIMANYTLGFKSNFLQFQGYTKYIDTFYLVSVVQNLTTQPSVQVQFNDIENSCNDISFGVKSVLNDAKRSFFYLQWSFDPLQGLSDSTLQAINTIFQKTNQLQSQSLVINKYVLPPDISITVHLFYILKVNQNSTLTFKTLNQKTKQLIVQSLQSNYPPIYRYMNLKIFFSFFIQICDQSGTQITQEPLDIQIVSQVLPQLNQIQNEFNGEQIEVDIQPYSIPQNTALDLQVNIVLHSNNALSSSQKYLITPEQTKLFIQISGGSDDRLVDYKSNITLIGQARDYEIQDPNSPQGIQLSWTCQNQASNNGDNKCYDYLKKPFTPQLDTLNLIIKERTFNPYQLLKFSFMGQKDQRQANQSIMLMIAELDIPPLITVFDDPLQLQQVNINDNISVQLIYNTNISTNLLTYAGTVLYNNVVVGLIKFDYLKVKLRLWDYFSDYQIDNPIIQVRFSVYSPQNIMPSLAIINFNINIPPQNCIFSVTPQTGLALQTLFTIQFTGCTTQNNPLLYQFFYYNQLSDYQNEIEVPQNILRRQIQDSSTTQSIATILPSGKLLMIGQAMDSNLAIFNSTIQLNIDSYQQDEQTLINLINKAIVTSSLKTTRNAIINLCIIGEEISKNNTLYNLSSINQSKIALIQEIINIANKLPNTSFLSTYSNKVIAMIQSSIATQQQQQSSSILNQINLVLNKQSQFTINTNNKLLNNNDIAQQNLVDSFKMLNSTTLNIDVNNQPQDLLNTQMNISDQIGNLINNITLPNQGQFQLNGNLISLSCEQVTQKNLQKYYYGQSQTASNDSSIYSVVITNYTQNPFYKTDEFQNYVKALQVNATSNFQISNNTVIKPVIQSSSNNSNSSQDKYIQMSFSNIKPSKYNLTCIQQQKQIWSSSSCTTLKYSQNGKYDCICKDQKPTTIAEDLTSVLDNKNLQTAFNSDGLQNILHFDTFYEYVIFWILSFATLLQLGLCYFGKTMDSKIPGNSYQTLASVVQTPQLNNVNSQQPQAQQLQNEGDLQNNQILTNNGIFQSNLKITDSSKLKEQQEKHDNKSQTLSIHKISQTSLKNVDDHRMVEDIKTKNSSQKYDQNHEIKIQSNQNKQQEVDNLKLKDYEEQNDNKKYQFQSDKKITFQTFEVQYFLSKNNSLVKYFNNF
ncbi:REJ domain protein (macronuclear) [Tetrahymena thermophila SB210]|uniref:REJ domain protein n=1 Tax=Tetrahymena thermophila (strain SB210) TaxID=312017 RepID=Q22DJ4_TETTS|nr:REJ domain protein [Tetrahymena thermophila SB210]EAR83364.2 REJ domain protein [Tetrahymena thermophila SB210]|eukprot:XP_001031027.2 REJ domain protein [Tetrahymena thermophila SB210]